MVSDPDKNMNSDDEMEGGFGKDGTYQEELADLGDETAHGADEAIGADEIDAVDEVVDEAPAEVKMSNEDKAGATEGVMVKYCIFCKETILADASVCKYCGHTVHIFEGGVFKQLWWFFWAGVISFLGSLLPFSAGEGQALVPAYHTFAGAFYLLFSVFMIFAMSFSIYAKRLKMGPVFLMFIPAIHCWWMVVGAAGAVTTNKVWAVVADSGRVIVDRASLSAEALAAALAQEGAVVSWPEFFFKYKALNALTAEIGSGTILLLVGSTIVALTFVLSLFSAVSGGGKAKGAAKPKRGRGRGR